MFDFDHRTHGRLILDEPRSSMISPVLIATTKV
jgi:hypothetical protein